VSPYLSIAEAAELLRISQATLRNKMCKGVFVEGKHFFRPRASQPLFKRAALEEWIEGRDMQHNTGIRMAGGYVLGSGR
jgi:excisionase family DNA binding protein